ncbi:rhodanese-like domain-containing protein [Bacteriovoracaceae bacterium]|nr:rhodanese-like domain-containing protein [Bacteriovoracaceae bacterium]
MRNFNLIFVLLSFMLNLSCEPLQVRSDEKIEGVKKDESLKGVRSSFESDDKKLDKINSMYFSYKKDFPAINDISVKDINKNFKAEDVIFVDVREDDEMKISMIPDAIDKQSFEKDIGRHEEKHIIVYCTIGYRSGLYTKKLKELGYDSYNLIGGVLSWSHQLLKFIDSNGDETNQVHVYGKKWNLLHSTYQSVY